MDKKILTNELVNAILRELPDEFDSHQFIVMLLKTHPSYYGEYLIKHNNVTTADGEIARYLSLNSSELNLAKVDNFQSKVYESINILGNISPCARWCKTK